MRRAQWQGGRSRAAGALERATVGVYESAAVRVPVPVRRGRAKSSTSFQRATRGWKIDDWNGMPACDRNMVWGSSGCLEGCTGAMQWERPSCQDSILLLTL
jgi:hypothetical protein